MLFKIIDLEGLCFLSPMSDVQLSAHNGRTVPSVVTLLKQQEENKKVKDLAETKSLKISSEWGLNDRPISLLAQLSKTLANRVLHAVVRLELQGLL
jgi:hypothetical protein